MKDLNQQLAAIREQIKDLKQGRVTHRLAQVTSADATISTFAAALPDGQVLSGVAAPAQFLPKPDQWVRLRLEGATPIYDPAGIAENAIGYTELEDAISGDITGAVTDATTAILAANGKNTVTYSLNNPSGLGGRVGDPWFKRSPITGVITGSWEWDGDSWEPRTYGDQVLSSLTVGKLTAGVMSADITISGRFATALTGARVEMNSLGFQKYDGSGNLLVSITGSTALLTGTYQSARTGRRIEMGTTGNVGRVTFYSATTTTAVIESYTDPESGVESIRQAVPVSGAWPAWNGFQVQSNERSYWSSSDLITTFDGGDGGNYGLYYATNKGTATTQPNRQLRFLAAATELRFQIEDFANGGDARIVPHGIADIRRRSPRLQLRASATDVSSIKFVAESDGANPRIEITNAADNYGAIWASAFTVSSAAEGKAEIADLSTDTALAKLRAMRVRTYRRRLDADRLGKVEIGLIAQEAPLEVVEGNQEAVNLYSVVGVTVAGLQRVFVILSAARDEIVDLRKRVAALEAL